MMKNQLAGLMKQAQTMQDNMKKAQEQLALVEVEGQSGAGLVKIVMTCKNDVKRVSIDPSLLADDKDMLEDLVAAAFNDAVRKAEATAAEKMSGLSGGKAMPADRPLIFSAAAAFNDAVRKAEATSAEKMSGLSAGMQLPPGFKMPF